MLNYLLFVHTLHSSFRTSLYEIAYATKTASNIRDFSLFEGVMEGNPANSEGILFLFSVTLTNYFPGIYLKMKKLFFILLCYF